MCRLAAYAGPPRPLAILTHAPSHSLMVQSYRPREMKEALLNADGSGAAWYPEDGDPAPCRYRSVQPLWSDENLASLAPRVRARLLLAVVRSATPGLAVGPASTPPFVHGSLTLMHNGYLEQFRSHFMRPLREKLTDKAYETIVGGTDTEHLLALLIDELGGGESVSLADGVRRSIATCAKLAVQVRAKAVLNLIVSDGLRIVATRFATEGDPPTLYVCEDARGYEGGIVLASEPLTDDELWRLVPPSTLLGVEPGRICVEGGM